MLLPSVFNEEIGVMENVSSYAGLQSAIREMETPEIETWENAYSDKEYVVEISHPEFTAVCPKTGLPDFASIKISYICFLIYG